MMSSLFLHSRNRNLKSYYEKTTKGKCVTLSNLKLLLLCFVLFQLLNKIDFCKSRIENLKEINTREFLYNTRSTVLGNQSVSAGEKYVILVARLGEQLLEKQILKSIMDIL